MLSKCRGRADDFHRALMDTWDKHQFDQSNNSNQNTQLSQHMSSAASTSSVSSSLHSPCATLHNDDDDPFASPQPTTTASASKSSMSLSARALFARTPLSVPKSVSAGSVACISSVLSVGRSDSSCVPSLPQPPHSPSRTHATNKQTPTSASQSHVKLASFHSASISEASTSHSTGSITPSSRHCTSIPLCSSHSSSSTSLSQPALSSTTTSYSLSYQLSSTSATALPVSSPSRSTRTRSSPSVSPSSSTSRRQSSSNIQVSPLKHDKQRSSPSIVNDASISPSISSSTLTRVSSSPIRSMTHSSPLVNDASSPVLSSPVSSTPQSHTQHQTTFARTSTSNKSPVKRTATNNTSPSSSKSLMSASRSSSSTISSSSSSTSSSSNSSTSSSSSGLLSTSISAAILGLAPSSDGTVSPPPISEVLSSRLKHAQHSPPSSIYLMRKQQLAEKSNSALLLDALMNKPASTIDDLLSLALTPSEVMSLRHQPLVVTQACVLNQPVNARASLHVGLGHNAKHRSRTRQADGFLGEATRKLEQLVKYLLDNGADPSTTDSDGNTPLWIAIQLKHSERIVKMLLDRGCETVEAVSEDDESSDDESVSLSAMRSLKSKSSESLVKVPSIERGSPIDLCMQLGQVKLVYLLMCRGFTAHRNGKVKLCEFARLHGFAKQAESTLKAQLLTALQQNDRDKVEDAVTHMNPTLLNHVDSNGRSFLFQALENKDTSVDIITLLLDGGADPNLPDCGGTPPAVYPLARAAIKSGQVLEKLMAHALDIHMKVADTGQTLLQFAREHAARPEYVDILLSGSRRHTTVPVIKPGILTPSTSAASAKSQQVDMRVTRSPSAPAASLTSPPRTASSASNLKSTSPSPTVVSPKPIIKSASSSPAQSRTPSPALQRSHSQLTPSKSPVSRSLQFDSHAGSVHPPPSDHHSAAKRMRIGYGPTPTQINLSLKSKSALASYHASMRDEDQPTQTDDPDPFAIDF